jgi:hypothetical protein
MLGDSDDDCEIDELTELEGLIEDEGETDEL